MRLFYDHLIEKSDLLEIIEKQAKTKKGKERLLILLDEILHSAVLDVILIHLDEKHHEEFLAMVHEAPHSEEILVYLKQKAHPEIEEKIKKEIERLKEGIIRGVALDN